MKKFVCQVCKKVFLAAVSPCPSCKKWGTIVPTVHGRSLQSTEPTPYSEIEEAEDFHRVTTGTDEFDRVLCGYPTSESRPGGAVQGSAVLISGPPGEGKSTLLLQMAGDLAAAPKDPLNIVYVSGEETGPQIKNRGSRVFKGHDADEKFERLLICNETDVTKIIDYLEKTDPDACIIDSIQTMHDPEIGHGNKIGQILACGERLVTFGKSRDITMFIVAQLNKDGDVAGPRALEHLVDTVLHFGADREGDAFRILRASKNRFGDTGEVGVFRMVAGGMESVNDPDAFLLRGKKAPPGSAMCCAMIAPGKGAGKRPMLIEVQALVRPCGPDVKAKRVCTGYSKDRIEMLLAILSQYGGPAAKLQYCDIYLNISGGFQTLQEELDLPVTMAMVSSLYQTPLPPGSVFWGEMGLLGEVRPGVETRKRLTVCETMKYRRLFASNILVGPDGTNTVDEKALVAVEDLVALIEPSPDSYAVSSPGEPSEERSEGGDGNAFS